MDKHGRKRLAGLVDILKKVHAELESMAQEEQAKYDSLPEAIQDALGGEAIQEVADVLLDQAYALDDIIFALQEYTK